MSRTKNILKCHLYYLFYQFSQSQMLVQVTSHSKKWCNIFVLELSWIFCNYATNTNEDWQCCNRKNWQLFEYFPIFFIFSEYKLISSHTEVWRKNGSPSGNSWRPFLRAFCNIYYINILLKTNYNTPNLCWHYYDLRDSNMINIYFFMIFLGI